MKHNIEIGDLIVGGGRLGKPIIRLVTKINNRFIYFDYAYHGFYHYNCYNDKDSIIKLIYDNTLILFKKKENI